MTIPDAASQVPEHLNWLSNNSNWLIPSVLLALQTFYKLFVFERASSVRAWEATLHLPVDICFLAIALVSAHMLLGVAPLAANLLMLLTYLVLAIVSVWLWKVCPNGYSRKDVLIAAFSTAANFVLTITMLYLAIGIYARTA